MCASRTYTVAGCTPDGSTTRVDRIPYTPPMIRSVLSIALAYLLIGAAGPQTAPEAVTYEAYAVRFGILPAFSVAGLVAEALWETRPVATAPETDCTDRSITNPTRVRSLVWRPPCRLGRCRQGTRRPGVQDVPSRFAW